MAGRRRYAPGQSRLTFWPNRSGAWSAWARIGIGLVTVTVSSAGALVDIDLDERVGPRPVREIRQRILEAFQAAQTNLARDVAKATAQTLGMRNPTSDAIVTAFTQRINHLRDDDDPTR